MKSFDRIVFTGDILRYHDNNPYQADKITRVLYDLFARQISDAVGRRPELVLGLESTAFDRERFYSLCGMETITRDNWLRIASGNHSAAAREYVADSFADALVICHEADSLAPLFEMAGISYIDMRLSPIRFLDDVHFAFKTNMPDIAGKLREYIIPESALHYSAGRVKSYYQARCEISQIGPTVSTCHLPANSLLLCGQIDIDSSLLRDGRIIDFSCFAEKIDDMIAEYDHVFFKPHPYALRGGANARFLRARPRIRFTKQNIYKLLADDNLAAVAALSSGVLTEAGYFGRQARVISHDYTKLAKDTAPAEDGEYVSVRDEYFSPTFWADILSPCLAVRECRYFNFANRADFMRKHLGMWWGYELSTAKGNASGSAVVRACRKALEYLDPSRRIRDKIDPKGKILHSIKSTLGQHK